MADKFKKYLGLSKSKAHDDRDRAVRNVCRLYGVNRLDALRGAIRVAALALID